MAPDMPSDAVSRVRLDLHLGSSLLRLGLLPESRAHEVATAALLQDFDSQSLRRLAGSIEPTGTLLDELEEALASAWGRLGVASEDPSQLLRALGVTVAKRILQQTILPIDGAEILFRAAIRHHDHSPEFHPFDYAYSEWSDRPEDHQLFETMIISGAKVLLESWDTGTQ